MSFIRALQNRVMLMIGRGVVSSVTDSKKIQSVQLTLSVDETRDAERFQQYGFTSVPKSGAEAVALAVGGERGHTIVIAVDDRRYRLRGLASGEVAIYNDTGAKVVLKADGSIEIVPSGTGKVKLGGTLLTQALTTEAFATAVCASLTALTAGVFPATPDLIPLALTTKTEAL